MKNFIRLFGVISIIFAGICQSIYHPGLLDYIDAFAGAAAILAIYIGVALKDEN